MQNTPLIQSILNDVARIFKPGKNQWKNSNIDDAGYSKTITRSLIIWLVIVFTATIAGEMLFNSPYGILFIDVLIKASRRVLLLFMVFLASTMIFYEVSRWHNIPAGFETSRRVVAFAIIPTFLLSAFTGLFPSLGMLNIFSLYSLFLLFNAPIRIFSIKPEKNIRYLAILLSSIFLLYIFIWFLLQKLTALIIY